MIHWKCLVSQETLTDWWNKLSISVWLQLSVCKELQLPSSEYNYTADLVAVTSAAPLESAGVQSISVLAVAVEGTARLWPSLAKEGNYTETDVDLGDLCNFVIAVRVSKWIDQSYFDTAAPFLFVIHHWELSENLNIPAVVFSIFISRCFPVRVEASSCPQRRIGCWERVWILQESCSTEPCCRARECSPASGAASPACSVSSPHQPTTQWVTLTDSAEKKVTRIYKSRTLPLVFSCSCAPWWDATFVSLTLSSVFCFPAAAPQRAVGGRSQLPLHADQLQSE